MRFRGFYSYLLIVALFSFIVAPISALAQGTEFVSLVSKHTNGSKGNRQSSLPSVSANGRYIAFESDAWTLVDFDTNSQSDVFLHDRESGQTTRVSITSFGGQAEGESRSPAISANGRFIAFETYAQLEPIKDTNSASPSASPWV